MVSPIRPPPYELSTIPLDQIGQPSIYPRQLLKLRIPPPIYPRDQHGGGRLDVGEDGKGKDKRKVKGDKGEGDRDKDEGRDRDKEEVGKKRRMVSSASSPRKKSKLNSQAKKTGSTRKPEGEAAISFWKSMGAVV